MGLTQAQMADKVGIALRTYVASEAEERAMDAGEIAALAELCVDLVWLLTGQGQMMAGEPPAPREVEPAQVQADPSRVAELEARIADLEKELADQRNKNDQWIAGAKNLLAGCMLAVDQMAKEQRVNIPLKQRANMVTSMFVEMASLSEEEIHTMMGGKQQQKHVRR
jgi:DNA-binding XRE family transcriptional regulator